MTDVLSRNLAGAACIAGGALRITAPLAQGLEPLAAHLLYLTVDALLLLGLTGLYGLEAPRLGRPGLAAFAVAVIGICIIRSQGAVGDWAYPVGAGVLGAAMALLGIVGLRARLYGRLAPASWIAAFALGALASAVANPVAMTAAGVVFGLGFVFAGQRLLAPPRP
ncbi:hypothetical protein [Phenylobacterium sp.]|uniref:hypothetical protein n=1 Tax=Phenylobacterium sp. TaxID=1871053 RepID=UPI003D29E983